MLGDSRRCTATRKDGAPCRVPSAGADGYCWAHSPATTTARQAARAKGGQHKATAARAGKLVPAVLRPVLDTLLDALAAVQAGTLTPHQAGALASLAGAIVKVYGVGLMDERLAALEAAQAAQAGTSGRWSAPGA